MSVTRIFSEASNIKFSDGKDVIDHTNYYQVVFDKIKSLIIEGL